jgi:hypothetical protein
VALRAPRRTGDDAQGRTDGLGKRALRRSFGG